MPDEVLIAIISAGVPTLATTIAAIIQARANTRHAAKQSILQMILEDRVAVQEKSLPTNYQNVLREYDEYHKNGGNSFVTDKVNDYKKWFSQIEKGK